MKKQYYIVYEEYCEYNQFEGSWDYVVEKFKDFVEAKQKYENLTKGARHWNHRNVMFLTDVMENELDYSI